MIILENKYNVEGEIHWVHPVGPTG